MNYRDDYINRCRQQHRGGQRISLLVSLLVDIPETSIHTGGGRRWNAQRMELQVSMQLWKLWPVNAQKEKNAGQNKKTTGKMKHSYIYEVLLSFWRKKRKRVETTFRSCWCPPAE